jgi:hypothetical protein
MRVDEPHMRSRERAVRRALEPAAVLLLVASAPLLGCTEGRDREEAASLVRVLDELRAAPNEAKRAPLERLRALVCHAGDAREARAACLDAFDHHVRGVELGARLRAAVDAGVTDAAGSEDLSRMILQMNVEIEEARERMPACEGAVASIRIRRKL